MASLPGATVLNRLKAGEDAEPWVAPVRTGWPCAFGSHYLASLGPGQWGVEGWDRWELQTHLSDIFQTLSLGCSWFGRMCRDQNTGAQD